MAKKGQHVVPSGGGWSVKKAGGLKASSTHLTKDAALAAAKTVAKNQKTGLFIHGKDGRIQSFKPYKPGDQPNKK